MNKQEAIEQFRAVYLVHIREYEKEIGFPDYPGRREAWNNYTDSLRKEGLISQWQYDTWTQPSEVTR